MSPEQESSRMSQTPASDVLTLEETAAYLRLPPELIAQQASVGQIPGRQIADTWRFLRSAIDDWLSSHDRRMILLHQAGALADDETLSALRANIYAQRRRAEYEDDT